MADTKQRNIQKSPEGYLRLPQVLELIPVGKSTWWKGCKTGRFPQSVKLGPRTTAWRIKDIHKYMDSIEDSHQ